MTERERFEQSIQHHLRRTDFRRASDGEYVCLINQALWQTWQASKAEQAAEVERLREALSEICQSMDEVIFGDPGEYERAAIAMDEISTKALSQSRSDDG